VETPTKRRGLAETLTAMIDLPSSGIGSIPVNRSFWLTPKLCDFHRLVESVGCDEERGKGALQERKRKTCARGLSGCFDPRSLKLSALPHERIDDGAGFPTPPK